MVKKIKFFCPIIITTFSPEKAVTFCLNQYSFRKGQIISFGCTRPTSFLYKMIVSPSQYGICNFYEDYVHPWSSASLDIKILEDAETTLEVTFKFQDPKMPIPIVNINVNLDQPVQHEWNSNSILFKKFTITEGREYVVAEFYGSDRKIDVEIDVEIYPKDDNLFSWKIFDKYLIVTAKQTTLFTGEILLKKKSSCSSITIPEDNADECTVCLVPLLGEVNEETGKRPEPTPACTQLMCAHIFHTSCLNTWHLHHSTCPLCRSIF